MWDVSRIAYRIKFIYLNAYIRGKNQWPVFLS